MPKNYVSALTSDKIATAQVIVLRLKQVNVTNVFVHAAILAVVSKESNFVLREETSYRNTPLPRIRRVFGTTFRDKSDAEIEALKADDKAFFDALYGGRAGNAPDEGYRYRGRGFNQLTFKGNYARYGQLIGEDLVAHPEKVNTVAVAAAVVVAYFVDRIEHAPGVQRQAYHFQTIHDFANVRDAADAIYNANAGWGKSPQTIRKDPTGGYRTTHERVDGFLQLVQSDRFASHPTVELPSHLPPSPQPASSLPDLV